MNLLRILILLIVALGAAPAFALPAAHHLGLGVQLGEPTAISGAYMLTGKTYLQGALGYSFGKSVTITADHVWIPTGVFSAVHGWPKDLHLTIGVGATLQGGKKSGSVLGVRSPVGLQHYWPKVRIQASLELAPVFELAPSTALGFMGGVGGRYFLK